MVREARSVTFQGRTGQRLVVMFANQGLVTINTAVAPMMAPKESSTEMSTTLSSRGQGWLESFSRESRSGPEELYRLPDAMSDPFTGPAARLTATLDSYRYRIEDPKSMLEWAMAQTGLDDPMTRYTRQELEAQFPRYCRDRDRHLTSLIKQIKNEGRLPVVNEVYQKLTIPAARSALERAMRSL